MRIGIRRKSQELRITIELSRAIVAQLAFVVARTRYRLACSRLLDPPRVEAGRPSTVLLRLDNVTLTPHIAGASVKTIKFAAEAAAEEVRRFLSGEPPLNPC